MQDVIFCRTGNLALIRTQARDYQLGQRDQAIQYFLCSGQISRLQQYGLAPFPESDRASVILPTLEGSVPNGGLGEFQSGPHSPHGDLPLENLR